MQIPRDVVWCGRDAVERFVRMIHDGVQPRLAEALACRQAPNHRGTEQTFAKGRNNNEDLSEMPKDTREILLKETREAGVDIGGKVYLTSLANKPCDPFAWVSSASEAKAKRKALGRV